MKFINYFCKFSLVLTLLFSLLTNAQTVNTSFATQINSTFQYLDKTKVPHKLLVNYAMEFEELSAYNGVLSTQNNTSVGKYTAIYNTLLMARIQTGVPDLVNPTTFKSNWNSLRQANKIVLSGLYYKYSEFKPDAPNNTITITNGKLYDKYINGVWQNPYNEKQVFAIATPITTYKSLSMQVQLPSSLWYTNQSSSVQSIAIDFNDGSGYQTTTFGQLKTVTYSTSGLKEWKYKLTLTSGQILHSHSKIFIDAEIPPINNNSESQRTINQPCSVNQFGIDKVEFYGTRQYLGQSNSATLEIDYRNTLGCGIITRPLIVVEGFDSGLLGVENPLGENTYLGFRGTATNTLAGNLNGQLNTYDIIYVNWDQGKDYIQRNAYLLEDIIKWVNSVKQGNEPNVVLGQSMGGLVARYALKDMENQQILFPNTIPSWTHQTNLYISHDAPHQGANIPLALQYFARHMADQFVNTPLEDMNINVTGNGGPVSIEDLQSLLDAPGTKQLLANYINSGFELDNFIGNSFRTELRNLGYPQQTRNIAISNGNHCAIPQNFNPGDKLFSLTGDGQTTFLVDWFLLLTPVNFVGSITLAYLFNEPALLVGILPGNSKFSLNFQGNSLPAANTTSEIYKGRITFTKTLFSLFGWAPKITVELTDESYDNPVFLPYDYYPGGSYNSFISNGGTNSQGIINLFLTYGIQAEAKESFNFIPTPSALDVGSGNVVLNNNDYFVKYNASLPPTGSRAIPFANFTTSHNPNGFNEEHISFNTRNGNWLATELDNDPNNQEIFNCLNFCSNTQIIGSSFLCLTGVYSVTNEADPNLTVWSISSGNNLATLTSNGNQVTLNQTNPNQSGYITLNATYSNGRCGPATATKTIWVGNPQYTGQQLNGLAQLNKNTTTSYSVNSQPLGTTHYVWTISVIGSSCGCYTDSNGLLICPPSVVFPKFYENNSNSLTTTFTSVMVNTGNCNGTFLVKCTAVNNCGTTLVAGKYIEVVDCIEANKTINTIDVYPNPMPAGNINVTLKLPPGPSPCGGEIINPLRTTNSNENNTISNTLFIYDFYGNKIKEAKFDADEFVLNDLNLSIGTYIINVFTNTGLQYKEVLFVR